MNHSSQPQDPPKRQPKPWEQQEGETIRAWVAFRIYRDMGRDRALSKVARELGIKHKRNIAKWSSANHWMERVTAYEGHLDVIRRRETRRSQNEMAKRHATMAAGIQNKVLARLKGLDPEDMKVGEMLRAFDLSVKIETHARQIPTRDIIPEDPQVKATLDEGYEEDETQVAETIREMQQDETVDEDDDGNQAEDEGGEGDEDAEDDEDDSGPEDVGEPPKPDKKAKTSSATMQIIKGGQAAS